MIGRRTGDSCPVLLRIQNPHRTQARSSKRQQQRRAWLLRNCFPDKNDFIAWAKYDLSPIESLRKSLFLASITKPTECKQKVIGEDVIFHINEISSEQKLSNPPTSKRNHPSAIQQDAATDENKLRNTDSEPTVRIAKLIYERKKSPFFGGLILHSLLFALAISGWQPASQNAVSCLGSLSGSSSIRNDNNFHYNHPILHSSHRLLNSNQPLFWMSPTINPDAPKSTDVLDADPFNGLPTSSSVDSFYSDQSSQAGQSSMPPTTNGWSSMVPTTNVASFKDSQLDNHVKNILVPRVSGTPGNVKVRQYIVDALEANDYTVQLDEFTDNTPIGKVKFANIIAYSNPNACRQLVLACHYDSKMMDGFLGAVDSAVPCAMLLKMSETSKLKFRAKDGDSSKDSLGLQFIFFDGEEAYHEWGPTDSLYGSRHLAAKWEKQKPPQQCSGTNELSRIELLVLLDLIGSKDTSFVMYTHHDPTVNRRIQAHHNNFRKYERTYLTNESGLTTAQANRELAFRNRQVPIYLVEDDHVPFLKRGVPILSLLASPFPKVWHTTADNYDAIDFRKTSRILHVLEEWLANYGQKSS